MNIVWSKNIQTKLSQFVHFEETKTKYSVPNCNIFVWCHHLSIWAPESTVEKIGKVADIVHGSENGHL